jgi:hypothetical protein
MVDYRYLRQHLMRAFQQLVIFDLREVKEVEFRTIEEKAQVRDLSYGGADIPKRYYMGSYNFNPLVIILSEPDVEDSYQKYLTIIYNLYGVMVKNFQKQVSFSEMEQLTEQLDGSDKILHWIWFRDRDTYLPDKIMSRAKSWIELNPDFTFYLWTNLVDSHELDDFLSTLQENNRQYFNEGRIIVKYQDELLSCLDDFCHKYIPQLSPEIEDTLQHLFDFKPALTKAMTQTKITTTHTKMTTVIETITQNNYKINRIFRVDLWRVIVLNMFGGIYCDFNDTICFYPMKYLLTMYPETYFVGTDYDIEHPIFRNNYFIYSKQDQPEFVELSLKCVNKGIKEYLRITDPSYIIQYYRMCLEFLQLVNQQSNDIKTNDFYLVPIFFQLENLKLILEQDPLKDVPRVITLVAEVIDYLGQEYGQLKVLSQRIFSELEQLDTNCLKMYKIRQKNHRRRRQQVTPDIILPIIYETDTLDQMVATYQFHDHFLMKYAIHMTIGDLILSTNISYINEIKNLIPYSRSNRLSTISMLTHIYDGTSYGLTKNYETYEQFTNDLRREFL